MAKLTKGPLFMDDFPELLLATALTKPYAIRAVKRG